VILSTQFNTNSIKQLFVKHVLNIYHFKMMNTVADLPALQQVLKVCVNINSYVCCTSV